MALLTLTTACAQGARDEAAAGADAGHVHFLIPGAPGGGWDGTARGVGETLRRSGLVQRVSYENLSGGGGGRALSHLIATAERQASTLMVSSTPSVIQALRGRHPQTYRELTPVCAVIGDYLAFVVRRQSEVASWEQLVAGFTATPAAFKFAGGSVLGGFDHLGTALALEAAGADIAHLAYVPYDTGGKAMAALLSGETPLLATGVGEAMGAWRAEQVRVLAVSAPVRISALPEVPTLRELGTGVELVNWRGFFGPPGLDEAAVSRWIGLLRDMAATPEWRALVERNGWVEILRCGDDFTGFLAAQEAALAPLLRRLDSRSSRSARRTAGG